MILRARSIASLLAWVAPSPVFAQVTVDWERNHSRGVQNVGIDGCVERPGGFWASGAEYYDIDLPGPNYIGRIPVLMRLDADGQLLGTTSIPIGFDSFPTPVLVSTDAMGRAYLAYKFGTVQVRAFDAASVPVWSISIPNTIGLVPGGLGSPPWGGFTAVVRTPAGGFAVAGYDASGVQNFFTVLTAVTGPGPYVATVTDAGRSACLGPNVLFVTDPAGQVEWSAPIDVTVLAMAFGPGGELAIAGRHNSPSQALVRVYEVNGAVRFTHLTPSGPLSEYRSVAVDRFGAIAVAGGTNVSLAVDGADGLTALFAPNGAESWSRVWTGAAGFDDYFTHLVATKSGDVHVSGQTFQTSSTPYFLNERQLAVVAYDRAGNERWMHLDATVGTQSEASARLFESSTGAVVSAGTRSSQNFVNSGYTPIGGHFLALRPQSRGLCYGDAQSAACPCGGQSIAGAQAGCVNSFGSAARLVDSGVASLGNDTLVLSVSGTTPSSPGLYFQGSAAISPTVFGDGLRCAGGTLTRLFTRQASGGASSVPALGDPTLSARSAAGGDVLAPGTTRIYQVTYRDLASGFCPAPAGGSQNTSSALAIHWTL